MVQKVTDKGIFCLCRRRMKVFSYDFANGIKACQAAVICVW